MNYDHCGTVATLFVDHNEVVPWKRSADNNVDEYLNSNPMFFCGVIVFISKITWFIII